MAYRAVVRHVRYWRGQVHRWSTVYTFAGTLTGPLTAALAQSFMILDDGMCYGGTTKQGGTYECSLYNTATGGVPVATYTAFDWTAFASWVAHRGTFWTGTGFVTEPQAEVAMQVQWPVGLSTSGKPVTLKKWYHAVPQTSALAGAQDVPASSVTSLAVGAANIKAGLSSVGLVLSTKGGTFAGTGAVEPYYKNHQMPRGRRRPKA